MTNEEWVSLVNGAAQARGETPLPADVVVEAVDRAINGIAAVASYPGGFPSLKAVYDIGKELAPAPNGNA